MRGLILITLIYKLGPPETIRYHVSLVALGIRFKQGYFSTGKTNSKSERTLETEGQENTPYN